MIRPQTQCPGCRKTFSLNGYSQHVSRTRRAVCRAVHIPEPRRQLPHFRAGCGLLLLPPVAQLTPLLHFQADSTAQFAAARSPPDPDVSAPSQAMNGIVYSLKL